MYENVYNNNNDSFEFDSQGRDFKTNKQQNNYLNKNIIVQIFLISKHALNNYYILRFYCFTLRRFTSFFS